MHAMSSSKSITGLVWLACLDKSNFSFLVNVLGKAPTPYYYYSLLATHGQKRQRAGRLEHFRFGLQHVRSSECQKFTSVEVYMGIGE